jgi:hypothetical protein
VRLAFAPPEQRALSVSHFRIATVAPTALVLAALVQGCDKGPETQVILDNDYPPSAPVPLVIYRAFWQAVALQEAVAPGSSSPAQSTVAASDNTAYVILAPGWDPAGMAPPTSFVLLQSRSGYGVHLDETLHIPVDDATFIGNCAAGSFLSQGQADFIAQRIFTDAIFPDAAPPPFHYDAATCTMSPLADGGS